MPKPIDNLIGRMHLIPVSLSAILDYRSEQVKAHPDPHLWPEHIHLALRIIPGTNRVIEEDLSALDTVPSQHYEIYYDGTVVGVMSLVAGALFGIYLNESHRRLGILKACVARMHVTVSVSVGPHNLPIYRKLGFRVLAAIPTRNDYLMIRPQCHQTLHDLKKTCGHLSFGLYEVAIREDVDLYCSMPLTEALPNSSNLIRDFIADHFAKKAKT